MLSGILSPGREAALLLLALTATAYLRALRHLPPGQRRLAAATPILLSMFLVPLLYDPETEPLFILLATNFPWLSNLAVLGWVQGRGPLAQGLPFRADLAFLLAPALPALPPSTGKGSRAQVPAHQFNAARLAFKLALLAASAVALECGGTPSGRVAALGRSALQSVTLYLFTSLGYEVAACQSQLLSGMPVMAPFNRPYLSSSLGDFWARRWNIVTGAKFRHMVYEPIAGSAAGPPATMGKQAVHGSMPGGSKRAPALAWRRAAAVCATFAASGVAHELGFWYLTRRLSGVWMLFFSVQGPLLLGEAVLGWAASRAGLRLPWAVRVAATLTLLHTLAMRLFYPGMWAHALPSRMLRQFLLLNDL